MLNAFHNWSDVRVFLAVLRTGSTLAASKQLRMAQPTVARRIDALEHALRLTLFDRDTRGFHPTKEALNLRAAAEGIEASMATFANEAEKFGRGEARPIRITMPRSNFSAKFSEIIADFRVEHPNIQFEFISTYEVLDLAAGDADVAIRITQTIDDDRLICRKLSTVTSSLYASQGYAGRYGLPKDETDFAGHSFVVYDRSFASFGVNEWLKERIDRSQIVSSCDNLDEMVAATKGGIGIGVIATSIAKDDDALLRCFPPPEGTASSSWLLISPEAYNRPEVKVFTAFFAPRYQAIFKHVNDPS